MDANTVVTIGSTVIAAAAALGGTLLGHLMQQRATRAQQKIQTSEARRAEILATVTALVSALDNHRRAQIVRTRALALNPSAPEQVDHEHSPAVHDTRSAVTPPRLALRMTCPALAAAAEAAVTATFALRGAASLAEVDRLRARAKAACDALVAEASALLATAA
ncbi:protein kilB [Kitasatospora sp. NPDC049285]|uniref:protein kilB n=1 Tax=Kitasatospora sp. NPDC049285 TaxID=3157096 RepID=UPI003446A24C